jgi:cell division protein FtsB
MYQRQQTSWLGEHWGALVVALLVLIALAFGGWGLWQVFSPVSGDPRAQIATLRRENGNLQDEAEQLRQRVATLTRSDQISRDANRDLQGALADRDEEVAGLRADVAFYERLVGATAQRRGLTVHALKMQQQNGPAWHFTSTLTQNLNRGAISEGVLTVSVEGTRGGKLQKLAWTDLRQQSAAPGVVYSFKYFQQVEGDVFLPADVTPAKVTVRLQPRSGAAIEQSFTWAEALRGQTVAE